MKSSLLSTAVLVVVLAPGLASAQVAASSGDVGTTPPVPTAPAQGQGATGLGDIIVTAQHRSENLQRTPMSIAALGGDSLTRQNITIPAQITQLVPAFRANNVVGPYANFTIRGIGTFASTPFGEPAVVTNVEGVPIAFITSAHGLLYDLQRVEILKGPQGTLYGRNASAGVINLIANKPGNDFGGNLGVSIGNYNARVVQGAVDIPISDTLKTRTAFLISNHDGYYKDGTDDEDNRSGRFTLQYKPSSNVTASIVADYSHDGGKGNGSTLISSETATGQPSTFIGGARSGTFLQIPVIQNMFLKDQVPVRNPANLFQDNTFWGVTGTLDWHTDIGTLTLIGAHRAARIDYFSDFPTFYYGDKGAFHQNSIEARFGGDIARKLKWIVGTFYLTGAGHDQEINEQSLALSSSDINITTRTFAVFAQGTYSLTDRLRLTGGVRYTIDHKTSDSPRYTANNFPFATFPFSEGFPPVDLGTKVLTLAAAHTWRAVTYKGGVEYDVAPDSLLYANIDRGYKAGVFFFASPTVNTANPEYVTSYTIGSKNRFFDRKLQVNLEGFMLDYTNQQLNYRSFVPGVGNTTVTANIGRSKIYGAEVDLRYIATPTTTLNLIAQYEHARYTSFKYVAPTDTSNTQNCPQTVVSGGFQVNCSGRPALFTPTWVIQGGIQQKLPLANGGDVTFDVNSRYETSRWLQISYIPEAHQGAYTDTDLMMTYNPPSKRWSVSAFVNNLENNNIKSVVYIGRIYTKTRGGLLDAVLQAPRTFGGRLDVKF